MSRLYSSRESRFNWVFNSFHMIFSIPFSPCLSDALFIQSRVASDEGTACIFDNSNNPTSAFSTRRSSSVRPPPSPCIHEALQAAANTRPATFASPVHDKIPPLLPVQHGMSPRPQGISFPPHPEFFPFVPYFHPFCTTHHLQPPKGGTIFVPRINRRAKFI